jgi:hypothetical protein
VMETLVGLMMWDGHSFLRQNPLWEPPFKAFRNPKTKEFNMPDFINAAITPKGAVRKSATV